MKRYLHEKIAHIERAGSEDEHILIVPGERTEVTAGKRGRVYSIRSPLVSRRTLYRVLLDRGALEEVLAHERPDIIETSDPYQLGWWTAGIGERLRIPVVAYYHSHFPQAYLREPARWLGRKGQKWAMRGAEAYVRSLYNRFEATLVASAQLAAVLREWGVVNVRESPLGVNADVFQPHADESEVRAELGIPKDRCLLLYVGRLAAEKNVETLFRAYTQLPAQKFHLLVIGDGQEADQLRKLGGAISWLPACPAAALARYYRAADLFVHPGTEETFGLAALESQACGTPVVGIRGSYMDDVILHDQNHWAIENSPEALAGAIKAMRMLDLSAMGAAASLRARERYAWPRVFEQLFSIYRSVVSDYMGTRLP